MNFETSIASDNDLLEPRDADRTKRNRNRIILAVVIAIAAIAAAYFFFGGSGASDGAAGADKQSQAQTVTVVAPGRETIARSISATGTLAARRDIPVGVVGEGGQVLRVFVDEGDWVQQGQVLASIERSVQSQQIIGQEAQINAARADLQLAQNELDRAMQLVSRGFISKADVDRKTATRDSARARVGIAEAQLKELRARTARLDIRAPVGGYILERNVEPGQTVTQGSGTLFRMAQGGELELQAQLGEAELAALSVGVPATVTPVGTDQQFTGTIWQIAPTINAQSRQGIARVSLPFSPALKPGGFASVQIKAGAVTAAILPESAIQNDRDGSFVYIVDKSNKVKRRNVKTGIVTQKGIAISEGLDGTERVVLFAGGFLNPDETVTPKLAKSVAPEAAR
ncbi:MAG: efflux RND transporter periplasmic adaptor subunit [Pseudomonadota bacterium]